MEVGVCEDFSASYTLHAPALFNFAPRQSIHNYPEPNQVTVFAGGLFHP